jgi:MFS family permease
VPDIRGLSYLLVLAGAGCCYAALGAVVRIAPAYVGSDLRGSPLAVGLAVGAPAATAAITRPIGGRLADNHGPRRVIVVGATVMIAGTLPIFISSYPFLLGSRLAVGVGEGAMMSASVLWLLRLAGPDRRGRALGHIGLANYAGLALGPIIADSLSGGAHPGRVFVAATLLPLGCIAIALLVKPGRRPPRRSGPSQSLRTTAGLVLGPGVGLLLVNVGYAALVSFGAAAVGSAAFAVLPVYAGTVIVVRTCCGGLVDRYGGRRTLSVAAPIAAVGLLITAAAGQLLALGGVVLVGIGQALAVPALGILALEHVPEERQGTASGLFFAWFDAGVGIGGPAAGAIAGPAGPGGALAGAAGAVVLSAMAARHPRRSGRARTRATCRSPHASPAPGRLRRE